MNKILMIFKNRLSLIWFIVTAAVLVLAITVNILASTIFYSLICIPFGGERAILGGGVQQVYEREYDTKEEAKQAGNALNADICGEGFVLLKNNNALPLQSGAKISVFGKNSVKLVYGGSGSGGKDLPDAKTIFDSLTDAGFSYNQKLKDFYNSDSSGKGRPDNPKIENSGDANFDSGETAWSNYSAEQISSFEDYNDAALVVLSRIGGEGFDLPRKMKNAADKHYLQLDKNETDLLHEVCEAGFSKVIVILNANSTMELGFLEDDYDSRINGCLWIGTPGETGIMALGKILKGDISPSGRTVDTYSRNFRNDPVWVNFGDHGENKGQNYTSSSGTVNSYYSYVDYEEGVYVGYRYFETRGFTDGPEWYKDNVVFSFGYGLSYTAFNQEFAPKPASLTITKDKFTIGVKVTNTGNGYQKAAKEVVQIYVTPPSGTGGIEKPYVTLAAFAKTPAIEAGASVTVNVEIDPYLFASYDSKNEQCFMLEAGNYEIKLGKNAHEKYDSFTATVASKILYKEGKNTQVKNRYQDAEEQLSSVLSKNDWNGTKPEKRTAEQRVLSSGLQSAFDSRDSKNPNANKYGWEDYPELSSGSGVKFQDALNAGAPGSKDYGDSIWESLLDTFSIAEMTKIVTDGQFKTAAVENAKVPSTVCADGPFGFVNFMGSPVIYDCCYYASEVVLASTWNAELAEALGKSVGNEALVGNKKGDGLPYSGWYAPGVNIHRSPFGGRSGEYFSEDPLLSGKMAAAEVRGARSKGVMTFVKHFAVNEQETSRTGIATWLTEQSLREIYLRPFELTVTEGKTNAMMSSFNRIGAKWTGGDYRLLTEILRDEWGFKGMVVCDYNNNNAFMDAKQMVYAGGDLHLFAAGTPLFKPSASSPSDVVMLRKATKNILYAIANSNIRDYDIIGYRLPVWQILMFVVDGVIILGLAGWGMFALKKVFKRAKTDRTL